MKVPSDLLSLGVLFVSPHKVHWRQNSMNLVRLSRVLFGLVWLAAIGCSSCRSEEKKLGTAELVVTTQGLSSADVSQLTVSVTGPGITLPITGALTFTNGSWRGMIANIPVGGGRTFTAQALDAQGQVLFAGSITGITISGGAPTLV